MKPIYVKGKSFALLLIFVLSFTIQGQQLTKLPHELSHIEHY